jgi:hypothetical protein
MTPNTPTDPSADGHWLSVDPANGLRWFSVLNVPWWIAGGWALDLFHGKQSRAHGDLDIGVLRRDIAAILAQLSSWEVFEAKDGTLTRLDADETPRPTVNSLWCRPVGTDAWIFELLLDESVGDTWCYRREPSIRRPLAKAVRWNESRIPYLAPEIQLLYKARSIRTRDAADFELVAPCLDAPARTWLVESLARTIPGHPWVSALAVDVGEAHDRDHAPVGTLLTGDQNPKCNPTPTYAMSSWKNCPYGDGPW